MQSTSLDDLSRRERQIMDILLELGEAGAEEVRSRLPDPPSYSAARAMLVKLEAKGMVEHREQDLRYVYTPAISTVRARRSAVERLVRVFFDGSLSHAVSGLLEQSVDRMDEAELDRIAELIDEARSRRQGSGP